MSDLHLSHTPPLARSKEEDWYGCMRRVLQEIDEVRQLRNKFGNKILKTATVVYPGDIFHVWNSPPELINFALNHLPQGYAVPGQHDLPNHNYSDIHKSAYWTLVRAGKLFHVGEGFNEIEEITDSVAIYGYGWGQEIKPVEGRNPQGKEVAIVHAYCWRSGCSYPNAPKQSRVKSWGKRLQGYDYAFFGDNHIPFQYQVKDGPLIVNCGSMMRRNIDQLDHKPKCWLLLADGKVIPHELDTSKDVMFDGRDFGEVKINGQSLRDFLDRIGELQGQILDFDEAVCRYLEKYDVPEGVRKVILAALEESK